MKKQILNLGKALNKAEQKAINGGDIPWNGCPHGTVPDECGRFCVVIGDAYFAPC